MPDWDSHARRWGMVRDLAVFDIINAETVGKMLDIPTEQAEKLVAAWKSGPRLCPTCGKELP